MSTPSHTSPVRTSPSQRQYAVSVTLGALIAVVFGIGLVYYFDHAGLIKPQDYNGFNDRRVDGFICAIVFGGGMAALGLWLNWYRNIAAAFIGYALSTAPAAIVIYQVVQHTSWQPSVVVAIGYFLWLLLGWYGGFICDTLYRHLRH